MDLQDWADADQFLSCDSCLQGEGAWFDGKYFHCKFPSFILNQMHLELLAVVVALKLWGKFLSGRKIVINCDSFVSCSVLKRGVSRVWEKYVFSQPYTNFKYVYVLSGYKALRTESRIFCLVWI